MLNLAEYRCKPNHLADYLPWACLVASGVVLNKDGSFQRTIRYRGPDLDSATETELIAVTARINNILRRFGSNWALFLKADGNLPMIIQKVVFQILPLGRLIKNENGPLEKKLRISKTKRILPFYFYRLRIAPAKVRICFLSIVKTKQMRWMPLSISTLS